MTTLYRPVLIESAEQAARMPVGTLAILDDDTLPVALLVTRTARPRLPWRNGKHAGPDENVVGAQALVPIEAEETKVRGFAAIDDQSLTVTVKTGLPPEKTRIGDGLIVAPGTPWEES